MISLIRGTYSLTFRSHYCKVTLTQQPKLKRRSINPIYPPPGFNL